MKPRFFLLFPLFCLVACSDTEQSDSIAVSPSTFGTEQFDELKSQIAALANRNSDFAVGFSAIESRLRETRASDIASVTEVKRLQDELDHLRAAELTRLQHALLKATEAGNISERARAELQAKLEEIRREEDAGLKRFTELAEKLAKAEADAKASAEESARLKGLQAEQSAEFCQQDN